MNKIQIIAAVRAGKKLRATSRRIKFVEETISTAVKKYTHDELRALSKNIAVLRPSTGRDVLAMIKRGEGIPPIDNSAFVCPAPGLVIEEFGGWGK